MDDPGGAITFEDFKKHVQESQDDGCGICFSLAHYKHLNDEALKLAWLGYTEQDDLFLPYLADELDRLSGQPIDDNIFFLVSQAELLPATDPGLRDRILSHIWTRASEMLEKKMPAAWVAVRAFGWAEGTDYLVLSSFLMETEDITVWQVVFQCLQGPNIPLLWKDQTLSMRTIKILVRRYLDKLLGMELTPKVMAALSNALCAMACLQDERVLEYTDKIVPTTLERVGRLQKEILEHQINFLKKKEELSFVPILEQLQQKWNLS